MLRTINRIVSLTLILNMVACSSTPLSPVSSFRTYTAETSQYEGDKIKHFMLSQDQKTLIMMGNKHHYSFQVNEDVGALLMWGQREKLTASIYGAKSTDGKNISVQYNLSVSDSQVTPEEITFLKSHGFNFYPIYKSYLHSGKLYGQFYQANDVDLSKFDKFKKEYPLMYEPKEVRPAKYRSTAENTGNSLLFLGAVIVIVPLALLMSPIQLFTKNNYGH